jgi:sigma-E factor negative regulatory protein RseA
MSTDLEKQRICCLMDGEAGRFEAAAAINDLLGSPELVGSWERWHLIRRALRREPNDLAARNIAVRVRAQLTATSGPTEPAPLPRIPHGSRWLSAPVGGALAAGMALLGLAVVLTRPVPGALDGDVQLAATTERWQQQDPAVRNRLDRLLFNHHEQMAGPARSGVGLYVAVIGYERLP